jgi:hypothetical protein
MSDEIDKKETQPKGEEKTAEVSEDDLENVSGGALSGSISGAELESSSETLLSGQKSSSTLCKTASHVCVCSSEDCDLSAAR